MSSKLSSLLVQDGVVSVKRMEEAFQRQVIYGGELDTVLLERGACDEATISRYLHLASGLPPGDLSALEIEEISPPTDVFPQKLAEKYRVAPVCREGNRLLVAVTVAVERGQLEELSFMLNMTLVPNVVPEVRVVQLSEAIYGVHTPRRYSSLLKKLGDPPPLRDVGVPARLLMAVSPPLEEPEPEQAQAPEGGDTQPAATQESSSGERGPQDGGAQVPVAPIASPPEAAPPDTEPSRGPAEWPDAQSPGTPEGAAGEPEESIWASGDLGAAGGGDETQRYLAPDSTEEVAGDEPVPSSSIGQSRTLVGMPTGDPDAQADEGGSLAQQLSQPGKPEAVESQEPAVQDVGEADRATSTSETLSYGGFPSPEDQDAESEIDEELNRAADDIGRPVARADSTPSFSPPPTFEADDYPKIIQPQQFAREAKGEIDVARVVRRGDEEGDSYGGPSIQVSIPADEEAQGAQDSRIPPEQRALAIEASRADEALKEATSRDEILQLLVKIMASRCRYAALFVIYGDHAAGKYAIENGKLDERQIEQLEVPLNSNSLFKTVVDTGSQYFGPVDDEGLNYAILTQLNRLDAPNVLAFPVKIKNRVVCVLYGDGGNEVLSSEAVADLAALPFLGSRAFLRIIVEAKKSYAKSQAPEQARLETATPEVPDKSSFSDGGADSVEAQGRWGTGQSAATHKVAPGQQVGRGEQQQAQQPAPAVAVAADGQAPETLSEAGVEALVDALEEGGDLGVRAGTALANTGSEGIDAVMKRFPGRLVVDRFAPGAKLPPVRRHGPVLHFLVWCGRDAVDSILPLLESEDPEKRFYATLLFTEIQSVEALGPLYQRLFDGDASVRRAAIEALSQNANVEKMQTVLEYLRGVLQQGVPFHRACASEAVGALRDAVSVPILISMVDDESGQVSEAVQRALLLIMKQAFGNSKGEWLSWWGRNEGRHRVEWMIDALVHPDVECRFMAIQELKVLVGDALGYRFDLPLKERHVAVDRWREWWKTQGKEQFGAG